MVSIVWRSGSTNSKDAPKPAGNRMVASVFTPRPNCLISAAGAANMPEAFIAVHAALRVRAGPVLAHLAGPLSVPAIVGKDAFCYQSVIQKSRANDVKSRRKITKGKPMGRPRVGSRFVGVRVPPPQLAALEAWIAQQPDPKPTIPEAMRRLTNQALACERKDRGRSGK